MSPLKFVAARRVDDTCNDAKACSPCPSCKPCDSHATTRQVSSCVNGMPLALVEEAGVTASVSSCETCPAEHILDKTGCIKEKVMAVLAKDDEIKAKQGRDTGLCSTHRGKLERRLEKIEEKEKTQAVTQVNSEDIVW